MTATKFQWWKAKDWHDVNGQAQVIYHNRPGPQEYFHEPDYVRYVLRQVGEFEWIAIVIAAPKALPGMIIARGQSDTDCNRKAREYLVEKWEESLPDYLKRKAD